MTETQQAQTTVAIDPLGELGQELPEGVKSFPASRRFMTALEPFFAGFRVTVVLTDDARLLDEIERDYIDHYIADNRDDDTPAASRVAAVTSYDELVGDVWGGVDVQEIVEFAHEWLRDEAVS